MPVTQIPKCHMRLFSNVQISCANLNTLVSFTFLPDILTLNECLWLDLASSFGGRRADDTLEISRLEEMAESWKSESSQCFNWEVILRMWLQGLWEIKKAKMLECLNPAPVLLQYACVFSAFWWFFRLNIYITPNASTPYASLCPFTLSQNARKDNKSIVYSEM